MPSQTKNKKPAAQKKKVVRFRPKINLLKHLNVVLLVAGFVTSLITVFALSSNSNKYDIRSRGQALPSGAQGIPPTVCLGGICPVDEQASAPGKEHPQKYNPDANAPDDNDDADDPANPDDQQDGDADKGHGNDEDRVDEDNPGQGNGGPNGEKNNPDQNGGGFIEQLMELLKGLIEQLMQLFGGGQQQQP